MTQQHVIIVGAGIIGAATAYALTLKGARVTVLEKGSVGGAATGRSFGWINANFAETPAYFTLRAAGIEAYRTLPDPIVSAADLQWGGSLWWEDEGDALHDHAAYLDSLGYVHEVIDGAKVSELEPAVRDLLEAAIWAQNEASVDATALTKALLSAACAQGGTLWDGCAVEDILVQSGRAIGVRTDRGDITGDCVMVATGAAVKDLLAPLDVALPMENKQGILVQTTPCAPLISRLVLTPDVHFRQGGDGRFLLGQIFSGDADGTPPEALAQDMVRRLRGKVDGVGDVGVSRILLGLRPVPLGGMPAVGHIKGVENLYVAATHSGITLGPLLGQIAAHEIAEGLLDPRLSEFRPDRF